MICPYCSTRNLPQSTACAHCGAILRGEATTKQAAKRPLKPSRIWRLVAIGVATLVGAAVGGALAHSAELPLINYIIPGALIGAALVYLVSGGKTLYLSNLYRARLVTLQRRINGALSSAQDRYEAELKKDASAPQTRLNLGVLQLLQDEIEKSVQTFQQAQRVGAAGADFDNNAGVALARRGSLAQSRDMFQRAVSRNGNTPQPHANLARVLVASGDGVSTESGPTPAERAMQELRGVLTLDAQNPAYFNRLGILLCLEGQPDQAEAQFSQALKLGGTSPDARADARCDLGVARFLGGHPREAAREFSAVLGADPGHARSLANLGMLQLLQGDIDAGLERLQNAAPAGPEERRRAERPRLRAVPHRRRQ